MTTIEKKVAMRWITANREVQAFQNFEEHEKLAERLISGAVRQEIRKSFGRPSWEFFEFYRELMGYTMGREMEEDLFQIFSKRVKTFIRTKGKDGKPPSPLVVGQIMDARREMKIHLDRIQNLIKSGNLSNLRMPIRKVLESFLPALESAARDKGVYLTGKPMGPAGWKTYRKMKPKEKDLEVLKDDDPVSYEALTRKKEVLHEIDTAIKDRIVKDGWKHERKWIYVGNERKLVHVGIDPNSPIDPETGKPSNFFIYDAFNPEMQGVDLETYKSDRLQKQKDQKELREPLRKKTVIRGYTEKKVEQSIKNMQVENYDQVKDQLEGDTKYVALTDDNAKKDRKTRILPTKTLDGKKIITSGRYEGIWLDDMVNERGRLVEGNSWIFDAGAVDREGNPSPRPIKRTVGAGEIEPFATTATVTEKVGRELVDKEKLFITVPAANEYSAIRNSLRDLTVKVPSIQVHEDPPRAIALTIQPEQQDIAESYLKNLKRKAPSLSWEVKDAKRGTQVTVSFAPDDYSTVNRSLAWFSNKYNTGLRKISAGRQLKVYFDPKDYSIVKKRVGSMSLSTQAMKNVKEYLETLAHAEIATQEENIDFYSMENLGGFKKEMNGKPMDLLTKQKQALAWLDANGNSGVLALDTGIGKCCAKDTLISTTCGLVEIQDMNPGVTEPDTMHPITGWEVVINGEKHPVKNFYYGGDKPTIKVSTRYGFNVEGSLIHPLLTRTAAGQEEWVKTPDLEKGDFLCVERKEGFFPEVEPLPLVKVNEILSESSFLKRIPKVILQSTRESQKEFLRGFVDTEGNTCKGGLEVCTASEKLSEELQLMLLNFGIVANRRPQIVKGYDHINWVLHIFGDDARVFQDKIGLVSEQKIEFLRENLDSRSNPNHDVVPFMAPLVSALHTEIFAKFEESTTEFRSRFGNTVYDTMNHVRFGRCNPTYQSLKEMLLVAVELGCKNNKAFQEIESVVKRNLFYDPIAKISYGSAVVMDIEVDHPTHCFVGNGLVNHNTISCIGMAQKMIRDGFLDDPNLNGRFLYVAPTALVGNMDGEIRKFLSEEASGVLLSRMDAVSYSDFAKYSKKGTVPPSLTGIFGRPEIEAIDKNPDWSITEKKQRTKEILDQLENKTWELEKYITIFFDEAQALKKTTSAASKAAFALNHPRKIPLTASPMEKDPREAYVLAALANNINLTAKDEEGITAKKEMAKWKKRFCEVVGGRIVGAIQDPDTLNDLDVWVKTNIFYAHKKEVKEKWGAVPEIDSKTFPTRMDPQAEKVYKTVAHEISLYLNGMAKKLQGKITTERGQKASKEYEKLFGSGLRPFVKILNQMSLYPEKTMPLLADLMEGNLPKGFLTEREVKIIGPLLSKLRDTTNPQELREVSEGLVNPKVERAIDHLKKRATVDDERGVSRALLFSDDPVMVSLSAEETSKELPGIHVAALQKRIELWEGGKKLDKVSIPIPEQLIQELYPIPVALEGAVLTPEERQLAKVNTKLQEKARSKGVEEFSVPFTAKAYRLYPSLPADDKLNLQYEKSKWQKFVLDEVVKVGKGGITGTCTLLGKYGNQSYYSQGQNLQEFDRVLHLDRDSWNSEEMKQRTARSWRQGQQNAVQEIIIDTVYSDSDANAGNDPTLDQVRKFHQRMESKLFDRIIWEAQKTDISTEYQESKPINASYLKVDQQTLEYMTSPYYSRSQGRDGAVSKGED